MSRTTHRLPFVFACTLLAVVWTGRAVFSGDRKCFSAHRKCGSQSAAADRSRQAAKPNAPHDRAAALDKGLRAGPGAHFNDVALFGHGASKSTQERRIAETLNETTQIEFIDLPLKESMEFLSQMHDIPIVIDEHALNQEGIPSNTPITRTISGPSLRSALNIILEPLGLTYVIENEVLKIIPDNQVRIAVYDVRRLEAAGIPADRLAETLRSVVPSTPASRLHEVPQRADGETSPPADAAASDGPGASATGVAPGFAQPLPPGASTTGNASGPAVQPLPGFLVVRHTAKGHRTIARLLTEMQAATSQAR